MSSTISSAARDTTQIARSFVRYLPEPAMQTVGLVQNIADTVKSLTSSVVGGVPTQTSGDFAQLLGMQIEAQREMQTTTMVSNVERSKHESKMAAIRNMRMG